MLGSASEEELRQLDHLLSLMADFRVAEEDTGKQTSRGGLIEREVNFVHALLLLPSLNLPEPLTEDKEEPTWGTTVAGVSIH